MTRARWRLPEAPRPSRLSSRGTAALFCGVGLCVLAPSVVRAGAALLLEPQGRPFCSGAMGPRVLVSPVADGAGGFFLPSLDERRSALPRSEQEDVFLIHLGGDLRARP